MTIYQVITVFYYVIVLYFAVMLCWRLITEERVSMQVAIAVALLPFLYRLLYLK